jgi:hypothetical protein
VYSTAPFLSSPHDIVDDPSTATHIPTLAIRLPIDLSSLACRLRTPIKIPTFTTPPSRGSTSSIPHRLYRSRHRPQVYRLPFTTSSMVTMTITSHRQDDLHDDRCSLRPLHRKHEANDHHEATSVTATHTHRSSPRGHRCSQGRFALRRRRLSEDSLRLHDYTRFDLFDRRLYARQTFNTTTASRIHRHVTISSHPSNTLGNPMATFDYSIRR